MFRHVADVSAPVRHSAQTGTAGTQGRQLHQQHPQHPSGPEGAADGCTLAALPYDWRRMHTNGQLSQFAVLPILSPDGGIVAAVQVAGPAAQAAAVAAAGDEGAGGGSSNGGGGPEDAARGRRGGQGQRALAQQREKLERFAAVVGLACFGEPMQLAVWQAVSRRWLGLRVKHGWEEGVTTKRQQLFIALHSARRWQGEGVQSWVTAWRLWAQGVGPWSPGNGVCPGQRCVGSHGPCSWAGGGDGGCGRWGAVLWPLAPANDQAGGEVEGTGQEDEVRRTTA